MVKKTTPEKMAKSISALSKQGILTTTLWIVGYSGETEQEFNTTLSFTANEILIISALSSTAFSIA